MMATVRLCGLKPLLHRRKSFASEWNKNSSTPKKPPKRKNEGRGESMEWSFVSADQLILMMEVHKKILVFRDILDLDPLKSSASLREMVIKTLDDLQRLYPGIISRSKVSKIKEKSTDQGLAYFCEALKLIGESWMMSNDFMQNKKYYEFPSCKDNSNMRQLGETMLATLDYLIKIASDKFDIMEEDDQKKGFSLLSSTFSCGSSPATPNSVLPEPMKYGARTGESPRSCGSSPLWSLRIQAVGKLNPIDLKRLSFHMSPRHKEAKKKRVEKEPTIDIEFDHKDADHVKDTSEGMNFELDKMDKPEITNGDQREINEPLAMEEEEKEEKELSVSPTPPIQQQSQKPLEEPTSLQKETRPISSPPSTPPRSTLPTPPPPPPPPPPPIPKRNVSNMAMPPPPPPAPTSTSATSAGIPAPPPLLPFKNGSSAPAPPPPPLPLKNGSSAPAPPSPLPLKNGSSAPAPPPPMSRGSPNLRAKATKLKRSKELGNMYRLLQGKVEGSSLKGRPSGGRGIAIGAASAGGKQGMADALAEMTKRSSYFQQIEEDVQKYTKQIMELRPAITNFKTNDMKELIKFHRDVESVLENLTDESQVLSRFEGFPSKKLEALRMAAALYNKLDSILTELQNWNLVNPVDQLLDKTERYFNKIKTEIDSLERIKDEESKKFKGHNIDFDFHILVKIKEAMVDVSSNCMEQALKERRNDAAKRDCSSSEGKRKQCGKLLWRAFQFAFKVYTFAGGLDDRADKLTKELAVEIESDPNNP